MYVQCTNHNVSTVSMFCEFSIYTGMSSADILKGKMLRLLKKSRVTFITKTLKTNHKSPKNMPRMYLKIVNYLSSLKHL